MVELVKGDTRMTNPKDALEWLERKAERERNMTNEEWLRSATTEQLIEFLEKITDPHVGYLDGYWQEWLKQPHTEKE